MRTDWIEVADGVRLAVDHWAPGGPEPTGIPFVLAHGLASNARLWDGVADRLTRLGHPVVTVDLRGHGRSSKPDTGYDMATVAGDLASALSRLDVERPVVVGQSWGGNVVIELAVREPAAIRGVGCVDGGWLEPQTVYPDWPACRTALAPPRLIGRPMAEIERHIRSSHPDWPEAGIEGTLANFEVRADGTVAPWLTYDRHLLVLRGLWDHHPSQRYPAVAVPVLLMPADGGADRPGRKQASVDAAAAAILRARTHWFVGDHDIHAQRPDEVGDVLHAAATDGFLA